MPAGTPIRTWRHNAQAARSPRRLAVEPPAVRRRPDGWRGDVSGGSFSGGFAAVAASDVGTCHDRRPMGPRIVVLGAGFGGLEISSTLSDAFGAEAEVTLIERGDSFVFGYSKLDVLFGRASLEGVSLPYSAVAKPGVRLVRETITAIDPASRRVSTDRSEYEADYLVVALGADYDYEATPGLTEADAFYSRAGAAQLAGVVPSFVSGHAVIGVCGLPYKCTPAPSECALLLHDELVRRGVREDCTISYFAPQPNPVPPSPDAARAVLDAFAERDIEFVAGRRVASLDRDRGIAALDDGTEVSYDLFLGVPKHRAPEVVLASGLAVDGFIPVDPGTLATKHPGVYAVGDCATAGVPKAGAFAEGAGRAVAAQLIAQVRGDTPPQPYRGIGHCYVEFGRGLVGRVTVTGGQPPSGTFVGPSEELATDKCEFGATRRARWFGL
jgi:sulfide:quinone oxidoreductase